MPEVALLVPLVLLVPIGMIVLISRLSGWHRLAEHYPARSEMPRRRRRWGYGVFRGWIGYNGGLVVAADEGGLHLAALPVLLSFCHPRIFVPWSEVRAIRRRRRFFQTYYDIETARAQEIGFALRRGTFAFVREEAARAGVAGDYQE
jgi:hypothetical protein